MKIHRAVNERNSANQEYLFSALGSTTLMHADELPILNVDERRTYRFPVCASMHLDSNRQHCGYLLRRRRRASLPFGCYQVILFDDRTIIADLRQTVLKILQKQWRRNRGFRRFNEPGPPSSWVPRVVGPQKHFRQDS